MSDSHRILVIHDNPERYFQSLCERFPTLQFYCARNDGEVKELMAEIGPQILLSFRCDGISSRAQAEAAGKSCVRWIQVAGAGYDHLGSLEQLSCVVTTCAGVLSRFQAETVMGAIINLNFGFFRYQQQQQKKIYRKRPWRSLTGQQLLLIGLGNIGRAVAWNARHFGMQVTAVRAHLQDSPEVDAVYSPDRLPELLPKADFVSLHVPYNDTTHNFFDAAMLSAMKDTAYLLNTARGNLVDEQALISALENKHIGGAYLDVFAREPLPATSPLWELDNVLLTPHYCDAVEDWQERFANFFAENLQRWLVGDSLQNRLLLPSL